MGGHQVAYGQNTQMGRHHHYFYVQLIVQAVLVSSLKDNCATHIIKSIQNYYWTLCRAKAELELWEISLMSCFHLSATLFKHPGVSLELFRRKSLTNALRQQHW